jgi:prolyl-tRNA synthetase
MKQTQLFTKTCKDAPKDEESKNAQLLIRAGYIHKEMAGVYSMLPLGLRVIDKIEEIVRDEMNKIGGQEMEMATLQNKSLWEKTDRWDDEKVDNWFKTSLKNKTELGLGFTHEEPLTQLMSEYISSYKNLPVYPYQFQNKFRNELRAKSGIMRGREFIMKDLYSFSKDEKEHNTFYENMKEVYMNVFSRVGLGDSTFLTFASGGSFSEFSHEFQLLSPVGEDTIYVDDKSGIAVNKEVLSDEVLERLSLEKDNLREERSIEVGNIFTLGTKFSEPLNLKYKNEVGNEELVFMGSYGIGIGRLMGAIVENLSDESGIIWPKEVSPYQIHLITLGTDSKEVVEFANQVYSALKDLGIEVLYDDRDIRPGEKMADSELIGISTRVIIGKKTIESGEVEVIDRKTKKVRHVLESDIMSGDFLI